MAEIRDSLIVGMYEDGWTYSRIAAALGWATANSVGPDISRLRRNGLIGYRQPDHWKVAA
jgi:hypothetical protein